MRINLYIDRVIVSGVTNEIRKTDLLQKTIETELARLFHVETPSFRTSSMRAYASGGPISSTHGTDARGLGQQIAHSIYQGIRNVE
jgi:hypothetical protein